MGCDTWEQALSAIADGEDPGIDERLVDAHLRRCASCRSYRAAVAPASPTRPAVMPDLAGAVAREAAVADRAAVPTVVRVFLAVLAVQIMVLAGPDLFRAGEGEAVHDARHVGAFAFAYSAGLLLVVARPARAATMCVVGQVLAATLAISAIVDIVEGSATVLSELVHLPQAVSVGVLWWMTRQHARPLPSRHPSPTPTVVP